MEIFTIVLVCPAGNTASYGPGVKSSTVQDGERYNVEEVLLYRKRQVLIQYYG